MSTPAAPQLWPQSIPIIGGTGEKWAGKSKFGLNICPGNLTTLVYDFEQSCASYEDEYRRIGVPFKRVDVQEEMHKTHPNGYKKIDMFAWWLKHIRDVKAGEFRVIMVDPVTDLESGLTDWVNANPQFFGHTQKQYEMMSGIMWGDVKDYEKMILADICAKCETFYFTAHLGAEFNGKAATGKKKAKGKETLFELASLYLWFSRDPDPKGVRPNAPSATVLKGRLETAELVDGEVVSYSVLPPRLPVATPKAIREYFKKPAGKTGLTDAEKVKEETLTDDDRLKLQLAKAEADRDAAQANAAAAQATQIIRPTLVLSVKAAELEKAIRAATATEPLLAIGGDVKKAHEAGELSTVEADYLRPIFNDCGRKLKQAEAQQQKA